MSRISLQTVLRYNVLLRVLATLCINGEFPNAKSCTAIVSRCHSLRSLNLDNTCIDNYAVAVISRLPFLEELSLCDCKRVTSFAPLGACMSLRKLNLRWASLDDHRACCNSPAATFGGALPVRLHACDFIRAAWSMPDTEELGAHQGEH